MGDLLYMTRLRWDGRRGVAKLHGRCMVLREPPDLALPFTLVAIDYVPEVRICQIMPLAGPWRDMTPDEVAAADDLLWRIVPGVGNFSPI